MNTIEYKNSKSTHLFLFFASGLFVALGVWGLVLGDSFGLISMLFGGMGFIGAIRKLFDNDAQIIIDDEGITDKSLWVGKILWSDIQGAEIRRYRFATFIKLKLANEDKYLQRLSAPTRIITVGNSLLGFERLNVNLFGVAANENKVLKIILERSLANKDASIVTKRNSFQNNTQHYYNSLELSDFKPGDKVRWYKYPPLPDVEWPIAAVVIKITEKRVQIEFIVNGLAQVRYVKPENLLIKQPVLRM